MEAARDAHLYPDLAGDSLVSALAAHLAIDREQVAVGAGSLALLERLLLAYTGPATEVVHAWRSYEAYPIVVSLAGAVSTAVPLDNEYRHDVDAILAAVNERTRTVIVCNPNNPTGTVLSPLEIERLVESVPHHVLVVIDEAYREFDHEAPDTLALMGRNPNVVLLRTFSKAYALAGLRVGYLLGQRAVVSAVRRIALPFSVNRVAEAAAIAALSDQQHLQMVVERVRSSRSRLQVGLTAVVGAPPSRANFLWLPAGETSNRITKRCAEAGVSIRAFRGEGTRISVGDPDVERVLQQLL
jgi:histidinol-phosphate aminotransferase